MENDLFGNAFPNRPGDKIHK